MSLQITPRPTRLEGRAPRGAAAWGSLWLEMRSIVVKVLHKTLQRLRNGTALQQRRGMQRLSISWASCSIVVKVLHKTLQRLRDYSDLQQRMGMQRLSPAWASCSRMVMVLLKSLNLSKGHVEATCRLKRTSSPPAPPVLLFLLYPLPPLPPISAFPPLCILLNKIIFLPCERATAAADALQRRNNLSDWPQHGRAVGCKRHEGGRDFHALQRVCGFSARQCNGRGGSFFIRCVIRMTCDAWRYCVAAYAFATQGQRVAVQCSAAKFLGASHAIAPLCRTASKRSRYKASSAPRVLTAAHTHCSNPPNSHTHLL